jgi:hypothetical protein
MTLTKQGKMKMDTAWKLKNRQVTFERKNKHQSENLKLTTFQKLANHKIGLSVHEHTLHSLSTKLGLQNFFHRILVFHRQLPPIRTCQCLIFHSRSLTMMCKQASKLARKKPVDRKTTPKTGHTLDLFGKSLVETWRTRRT